MDILLVLLVAALVFGVCFLVDKGFQKVFRSQAEHQSGKAVRLSKRYGAFGVIMFALGTAAIFAGMNNGKALLYGGIIVVLMGIGLVVYYMSHGIFYDTDSFIYMTLGKHSAKYYYRDIQSQQLYNNQGHLLIELYMTDGKVVQVQSTMTGALDFMDHAFCAWLRQTGRTQEACGFYDPANCCWFPPVEG